MLWLAAAAAIGTLEEDFGTLVEERSLHLDKSAANMWRLYVPSISVTAVNGQTFGDQARDIASAEGWSLEGSRWQGVIQAFLSAKRQTTRAASSRSTTATGRMKLC